MPTVSFEGPSLHPQSPSCPSTHPPPTSALEATFAPYPPLPTSHYRAGAPSLTSGPQRAQGQAAGRLVRSRPRGYGIASAPAQSGSARP